MVTGVGSRQPFIMAGVVSGIDTASLIQGLLNAKKGTLNAVQDQVTDRERQAGALKDVKTRLTNLLTQVKNFTDAAYTQGKTGAVAPGGSSATVSVNAGSTATVGSFKATVNQLADATRVSSPNALGAATDPNALLKNANLATPITAGTFSVNGTTITIDPNTQTLNDVITQIQGVAGITGVTLVNDPSGRANRLEITGSAPVTLGSGADTSNFLGATKLLSSPSGANRTSTGNLGVVRTGEVLATTLAGLNPGGSFKVNGVDITYDASRDSLSTVLTRINNSTAGVTSAYDAATDTVTFTSKKTGSTAIALEDTGAGNFLDRIGVRTATQTLGKNAQVQIDTGNGPVTYYSTSNTVTDAVQGVSLTLLKESATADTVTVGQDTSGAVNRMKEFVSQFNSTLTFINTQTDFDAVTGKHGVLAGDAGIQSIASQLRTMITARIDGVAGGKRSLSELGVSFGAIGSKAGTANTLSLDETKFKAALEADPAGVANVLSAFRATAALGAGGAGNLQSAAGDPTGLRRPGKYTISTAINGDGTANITSSFKPSDGGAAVQTTLINVAAGSTNTGLIPGTTLTFNGAFVAGADTITIATPTRGIAAKLEQFIDPLTRADGTLQKRQDGVDGNIKSLKERIDRMNVRLNKERDLLQRQFARMEVALQKLNEQRSSLQQLAMLVGG